MAKIPVGIVGVTGYAGQDLLRLLRAHPGVRIAYLASSGKTDPAPVLRHHGRLPVPVLPFDVSACARACRTVFLALPHETSLAAAPALLKAGLRVLDLSAAFRLEDPALYPKHYGFTHSATALLASAVYGLPELAGPALRKAKLIAVPGCYPTGPSLALAPLMKKRLVTGPVIIDSKSGVTGAGRETKPQYMFAEVNENVYAYGVHAHRHEPEIRQTIARAAGKAVPLTFTPHLIPMNRGILSTIYVRLKTGTTKAKLLGIWRAAYAKSPFVRIVDDLPQTRHVTRTNFCDIGVSVRKHDAIIVTAIDNLVKGAAGQAVQAFNASHGLPQTAGLLDLPGAP